MASTTAEVYSQQANPAFEAALTVRSVSRDAAFFVPYLRPGMRLLDVGSGPGSITLGFDELIAPGETIGVDIQPAQVEQARALAAMRGLAETVRFLAADIYALPFPDGSFDAIFANGVLMHLGDPARALAELHRVLRPGGVAGVRDPDFGTTVYAPMTPLLARWLAVRVQVRRHNGGDPFISRRYRRQLLEAGFATAEAGASVDSAGNARGTLRHAAFLQAMLRGFAATAIEQGWMDQAALDATATEIDAWAQRADAFYSTTWCHAVGWRRP